MSDGGVWSVGGVSIPLPESLIPVDAAKREINSSIVFIGSGAADMLRHIHQSSSPEDGNVSKTIDATRPGEPAFNYVTRGSETFAGSRRVFISTHWASTNGSSR